MSMKKMIKPTLFFLFLALFMINCEDDVKEGATIEGLQGQATIRGIVYINNDQTTDDDIWDEAAANARIRVSYYAADLSYSQSNGTADYVITVETTTDAQGQFSVTVPTIAAGVDFLVEADQYHTTITYDEESSDAYFEKQSQEVSDLKTNEERVIVINYGSLPEIEL